MGQQGQPFPHPVSCFVCAHPVVAVWPLVQFKDAPAPKHWPLGRALAVPAVCWGIPESSCSGVREGEAGIPDELLWDRNSSPPQPFVGFSVLHPA